MAATAQLLDEGVGVFYEAKAEIASLRREVVSLELAVAGLMQVVRQVLEARRSDREILLKILDACTREGGGDLADAIKHIEAAILAMGGDVKAILGAMQPPNPTA